LSPAAQSAIGKAPPLSGHFVEELSKFGGYLQGLQLDWQLISLWWFAAIKV
jgi:hypothetical protein